MLLEHTENKGLETRGSDTKFNDSLDYSCREKKVHTGLPMLDGLPWDRESQHSPTGQI